MSKKGVLGIAGATGLIGNEIVALLDDMKLPLEEVRLFASEDSRGELYKVGEDEIQVDVLEENSFTGVDIAVFATCAELSSRFVPSALKEQAAVIDISNQYRMNDDTLLIVPGVNDALVSGGSRMLASPCASVAQAAPVLNLIRQEAGLKRIVMSTYQPVSEAGKYALDELWDQTLAIFNQQDLPIEHFQHQIAFNCIPQIDLMSEDGSTREEQRVGRELSKVLNAPGLKTSVTAVRVPVLYGLAQSINVETERLLPPARLVELLQKLPGMCVDSSPSEYPMPLSCAGSPDVHVGRIRADSSVEFGLNLWIVADNVRRGAALNTLGIVKLLVDRFGGSCS